MKPSEVYDVLKKIGASNLHHANTVTTSCTFLENGGLLSRWYVESNGLKQTAQSSDDIDKKYNIWDDVFVDHVDIHYRAGAKKGPNLYGPVLFVLPLDLLLNLPEKTNVLVTRMNPIHWKEGQADEERWYLAPDELLKHLSFGDFDKMLVITTPERKVNFPGKQVQVVLDDPKRKLSDNDAYEHAQERLRNAAKQGGIKVTIGKHGCRSDCVCIPTYKAFDAKRFSAWFE